MLALAGMITESNVTLTQWQSDPNGNQGRVQGPGDEIRQSLSQDIRKISVRHELVEVTPQTAGGRMGGA